MASKFGKQADAINLNLGTLFNRAIRLSLLAGLAMAVRTTKHDSSNAAAHWLIAAEGVSRPQARRWGKLRDLRGNKTRPGTPPVGRQGDAGRNAAMAERFTRNRELSEVIEKLVAGRRPATKFYFYHALEADSRYGVRANIQAAGAAAVQETIRVAQNRMASGQARKTAL